jgi:bifunctional DNA-binding transcriptional regulator/antitoxin component of YhaV-PrlF toxin-antitoxin module
MNIQAVGIIRQRGQFTIPDKIRDRLDWLTPSSTVTITSQKPDEIVIKPYIGAKKGIDWNKIWEGIRRARAIKGKGETITTAEFLQKDRRSH